MRRDLRTSYWELAKAELDFRMVFNWIRLLQTHIERSANVSQTGRLGDAAKEYSEAIKLDPGHAAFYYYRGLVRADQKDKAYRRLLLRY